MTGRQFLHIVELRTKVVSISSFLLGTLFAVFTTGSLIVHRMVLMFVAVLAVDMGTTSFNSFFDYLRRVDDKRFNREEDKVLLHEGVSSDAALAISLLLFLIGALFGIALAFLAGWELIAAGGVSMCIGFLYNAGPKPISSTPAGEIFAGGFLGTVLIMLSYFAQTGEIAGRVFLISLPSFLLIGSILTVNNTCDRKGDRISGRKTLPILIGQKAAAGLVYTAGFLAYAGAFTLTSLRFYPWPGYILFSLSGGYSVLQYIRMHRRGYSHETKGMSMGSILRIFSAYSIAAAASLLWGIAAHSFPMR